jgi:hypothetical protein
LEVERGQAREDHEPGDRVDQPPVRDPDEDRHDPEQDQRDQRAEADACERGQIASGGVSRRAEAGDEESGRAARLPDDLRVGARVVADRRRRGQSHEDAEGEQQRDRRLLRPLRRGVETEQAREGRDEQRPASSVREVAANIPPDCEEARRDGDEAHRLPEQGPALVQRADRDQSAQLSTTCRNGFPFSTT